MELQGKEKNKKDITKLLRKSPKKNTVSIRKTVDEDILATSQNGDRKIKQPIRITNGPVPRRRKWIQSSWFRSTHAKVIPIENTKSILQQ